MVVVVGTKEHIRYMTNNDRQQLRFTGLCNMLQQFSDNEEVDWFMKLLELIFPYKCPFCGKLISDKDANQNKCEECAIKLKKNKFEFCNNTYDFLPNNKALYCVYRYNIFGMLYLF